MGKLKSPLVVDSLDVFNISILNKTEIVIKSEDNFTEYIRKMVVQERNEQARLNAKYSDFIVVR